MSGIQNAFGTKYAYHLRETNLVTCLRAARIDGQQALAQRLTKESLAVMTADLENVCKEKLAKAGDPNPTPASTAGAWPEMEAAINLAQRDLPKFLGSYYGDVSDKASKGIFSTTSR